MLSSAAKFCACLLLLAASACKQKDEAPAPIASVAPTVPPVPVTPATTSPIAPATAPAMAGDGASSAEALADAASNADADPDAGNAKKVSAGAGIKRCCAALSAAVEKDTRNANRYKAAAAVCNGLAKQVNTGAANAGAARTTLRAQLQGVPVPGGC